MHLTKIVESIQNPGIIRVGDQVVITKPEFVTRVGYPMSFADAIAWAEAERMQEINALLNFGPGAKAYFEKEIVRATARAYLKYVQYGGKERSIYTRHLDEELGRVHTVNGKCVVNTGTYYPGEGTGEDYEPGGLDKRKSHVLLCLDFWVKDFAPMTGTIDDRFTFGMWIERCNVKVIARAF